MAGSSNKVSFTSTGEEGISLSMEVSASEDDELRVHITSTTNHQTLTLIVEVTCPYNPESMVATIHGGEVLHFMIRLRFLESNSMLNFFENKIVITGDAPLVLHELHGDIFGFPGWVFLFMSDQQHS